MVQTESSSRTSFTHLLGLLNPFGKHNDMAVQLKVDCRNSRNSRNSPSSPIRSKLCLA